MPGAIYKDLVQELSSSVPNPEAQALWILQKRTDYSKTDILTSDIELSESESVAIAGDVKAIQSGIPLTRHYAEAEFWGLEFGLNDATLDPRPDTERIIELALERFPKDAPLRILDLGTGSGCLLISLLSEFPNASGVGADLSSKAIQKAAKNAKFNEVDNRSEWVESDWFKNVAENRFDLIVSNPPYIDSDVIESLDESVKNHDPILALDGGQDGIQAYRHIFSDIFSYLKQDGIGLFEIGFDQKDKIMRLSKNTRIRIARIHDDYAGNPRVAEIAHQKPGGDK